MGELTNFGALNRRKGKKKEKKETNKWRGNFSDIVSFSELLAEFCWSGKQRETIKKYEFVIFVNVKMSPQLRLRLSRSTDHSATTFFCVDSRVFERYLNCTIYCDATLFNDVITRAIARNGVNDVFADLSALAPQ